MHVDWPRRLLPVVVSTSCGLRTLAPLRDDSLMIKASDKHAGWSPPSLQFRPAKLLRPNKEDILCQ